MNSSRLLGHMQTSMVGVSGSLAQAAIVDARSYMAAHTIGAENAIG
jgi:hypothetical protein